MSAAHTWFARSMVLPRRRYGETLCPGCPLLVFRFGLTAHSPSFLISRRTRRRPIEIPSRNSATWSRRDRDPRCRGSRTTRLAFGGGRQLSARSGRQRSVPFSPLARRARRRGAPRIPGPVAARFPQSSARRAIFVLAWHPPFTSEPSEAKSRHGPSVL